MDTIEPGTPNSKVDVMPPTIEGISSTLGSPGRRNDSRNQGISLDDVNGPVPGWPAFARIIANKPAFQAFPSFADLSAKSLLYYQAELISLRKKLHEAEYEDHYQGDGDQTYFAEDLDYLIEYGRREEKPKQWELMEQIRTVLNKYNTALVQFSQVAAFPEADNINVNSIRHCAKRVCDGSGLVGPGSQVWGEIGRADEEEKSSWKLLLGLFVSPSRAREERRAIVIREYPEQLVVPNWGAKTDRLTLWFVHSFIPLFHHVWKRCGEPTWGKLWNTLQIRLHSCRLPRFYQDTTKKRDSTEPTSKGSNFATIREKNLTSYSTSWSLEYISSILTLLGACLLPVVAIVVLSRVQTMGVILGLIALFNILFAIGLIFFSPGSSRIEIFSATATFSAVMVVFVQNKISQH